MKVVIKIKNSEQRDYAKQLNYSNIKFDGFVGIANADNTDLYAAFVVPDTISRGEFHEAVSLDGDVAILSSEGIKEWK